MKSDARHEVDARQTSVLIAFVEPTSDLGSALAESTRSDVGAVVGRTVATWRGQLGEPSSLTGTHLEPWVRHALLRDHQPPKVDYRIKHVPQTLPSRLADADTVSLRTVAGEFNSSFV